METQDLRAILVVAQERNISRAADRLFLSQPGLSRLVHRVEDTIGVQIFDRSRRELSLTNAGLAFCLDASVITDRYEQAAKEARTIARDQQQANSRTHDLRIGLLLPGAAELTHPIVQTYRNSVPEARVQVIDISGCGGEAALLDGTVDAAFLWTPVREERLNIVPLFDDEVVVLMPLGHHLADRRSLAVADLTDESFTVSTTMSERWRSASMLRPWRGRPDLAVPVVDVKDALAAVASGRAVTIAPRSVERWSPGAAYCSARLEVDGGPTAVLCSRRSDLRKVTREFLAVGAHVSLRLWKKVPGARQPYV